MTKYVLCKPQGGFNDLSTVIHKCWCYCVKYNRILLVNTTYSEYEINFSDYFGLPNTIGDFDKIKPIITTHKLTVYPHHIKDNISDFIAKWIPSAYSGYIFDGKVVGFDFNKDYIEDILVYENCYNGTGCSFTLFTQLTFRDKLLDVIKERFNKLPKPYISIQIRNTDYKCDYKKLYEDNVDLIHSSNVYIATDDKYALEYFKSKNVDFYNFTTFPKEDNYIAYHCKNNSLTYDIKIKDTLSDLCIIALSSNILSNSRGGYICLARNLHKNKQHVLNKIHK